MKIVKRCMINFGDLFSRRERIILTIPNDIRILFHKRDRNQFEFLSNFYIS